MAAAGCFHGRVLWEDTAEDLVLADRQVEHVVVAVNIESRIRAECFSYFNKGIMAALPFRGVMEALSVYLEETRQQLPAEMGGSEVGKEIGKIRDGN